MAFTGYRCAWHLSPAALIVVVIFASIARSGTYTFELTGITDDAHPAANYLQAEFDFDTRFSAIDSVRLEIRMPSGFGWAYTTGNSSAYSILRTVIHGEEFDLDGTGPPSNAFQLIPALPGDPDATLHKNVGLPPNRTTNIDFSPYVEGFPQNQIVIIPEGEPLPQYEYYWPDFLRSGQGVVTLQGWVQSQYHPIDRFGNASILQSTSSFIKPPTVQLARLVIEGTAVPEPRALGLVSLCLAARVLVARRARCPSSTSSISYRANSR